MTWTSIGLTELRIVKNIKRLLLFYVNNSLFPGRILGILI